MRVIVLLCACVLMCRADEGMWTFDNPLFEQLQQEYGFAPSQQWLDHLRLALVLTNHHVALGQLPKMSTAEKDYVETGSYAPARNEEMKSPDLEIDVLVSFEDVTPRIRAAEKSAHTEQDAVKTRKQEQAAIEKESLDRTGLRSDVVGLYQGGQ